MIGRLLIVDDYPAIRVGLKALFARSGISVCGEAANGAEAVSQVQNLHPDLVILDVEMPVMNGVQAAQKIRNVSPLTKILFFTSLDGGVVARALGSLADAFVPKCFATTKLIPVVKRLLQA